MPDPSKHARSAPTVRRHPSRRNATLRAILGAMFALSVLAVPQVVSPAPVAAGSSCTGWTSSTRPPRTIKVLDSRSGKVETVAFRKYVKKVMASGEWPGRLRMATLEAGALVTKQYAWYYAMKGNHRPHYVHSGRCYDVTDHTDDQLYKRYARPNARQKQAVDKTWGLSLRKSGRFFLTGYRAGVSSTCAADANGWKLYARSVEACAEKGWSSQRIIKAYLDPNLRVVRSNAVGPNVGKPQIRLRVGSDLENGATTVSWQPQPRKVRVGRFQLERRVSGSRWRTVDLPKPRARQANAWVKIDGRSRFRIRAADRQGRWGPWSYSPSRRAAVRGPAGSTVAGNVQTARAAPRKIKSRFTGRAVAVVMRTGPGMGRVRVFVDGKRVAVVNLDRAQTTERRLVYAKNWAKVRSHSIAIKPVAGHDRVEFNGFFVLR